MQASNRLIRSCRFFRSHWRVSNAISALFSVFVAFTANAQAPSVEDALQKVNELGLCKMHDHPEPLLGNGDFKEGNIATAEHNSVNINVAYDCDPRGNAHFDEVWVACDVDYVVEDNDSFDLDGKDRRLPTLYVRGYSGTGPVFVTCESWGCNACPNCTHIVKGLTEDGHIVQFPSSKLNCENGRTKLEILLDSSTAKDSVKHITLTKDDF